MQKSYKSKYTSWPFFFKFSFSICIFLTLQSVTTSVNALPSEYVTADPALLKIIKTEEIKSKEIVDSLRISARIELDQNRVARIGASVTGRITEINTELGERVLKQQQLALLNSSELGQAQSDFLKASSQVNLHHLALQRAQLLLQSDVIPAAELQDRQATLDEAEVDLQAVTDHLKILGMATDDIKELSKSHKIKSYSPVSASIDGIVIEKHITLGEVVQTTDNLFTLADLSQLWLVAEIPEQQSQWARKGDSVQAEIPALPQLKIEGKLIYVADLVNPETRTVTVRMSLNNSHGLFKPQMLATLTISKPAMQSLVVPSQAVIRADNKDYVFVQIADAKFKLRLVQLGKEELGFRALLDGLKINERIVTDGAFNLNNLRLKDAQD